jgi:hypothetical protein
VAGDALRALAAGLVLMVPGYVELAGGVAARAQRIAFGAQLLRVRLVAVHAGDAVLMHPALQEGAPDIDLLTLLTVGVVVRCGEHRQAMAVFERLRRPCAFAQRRAAGMAGGAAVHSGRVGRAIAHGERAPSPGNFHASFQRVFSDGSPLSSCAR